MAEQVKVNVVQDPDGDICGVFTDEGLDSWVKEVGQERFGAMDLDELYVRIGNAGFRISDDMIIDEAGVYFGN